MDEPTIDWSEESQEAGQQAANAWRESFQNNPQAPLTDIAAFEATAQAAEARAKHEAELLGRDNVVGVATSLKMVDGGVTDTVSMTVFVVEKLASGDVPEGQAVPDDYDGVPTDVVEVGRIEALPFTARVRPALPGYSIGHHAVTAGTFGCLVRDIRRCCCRTEPGGCCCKGDQECSSDYLILSNNHVLANVNDAEPGDLILQPGVADGGVYPSDSVATLERFEPIVLSSERFPAAGYNLVDAAIARPTHGRNVTPSILAEVMPRGIDQAFVGGDVIKAGRTTQVTTGIVLAVDGTFTVGYGNGQVAQFRHQIATTAMAAGGDSGSLLMDADLNAVGLLYAGSPAITLHNHIADVETALGVRPVTAPRMG
ncbi:MAG: trypsin-like peptidase domain-containing protein [Acidimicrobiales bacterium]